VFNSPEYVIIYSQIDSPHYFLILFKKVVNNQFHKTARNI